MRPMMIRRRNVKNIRIWREMVRLGDVETVYSAVVGEGRRVRRCGWIVSIALFGVVLIILVLGDQKPDGARLEEVCQALIDKKSSLREWKQTAQLALGIYKEQVFRLLI